MRASWDVPTAWAPHRAAAAVAAAAADDDDVTSLHSCSLALLRTGLPGDPWIKDLALIASGHLAHRADCPLCAWLTATFSLPPPPPPTPQPCGLQGHFTCPADKMLVFTQVVQWLVFLGHRSWWAVSTGLCGLGSEGVLAAHHVACTYPVTTCGDGGMPHVAAVHSLLPLTLALDTPVSREMIQVLRSLRHHFIYIFIFLRADCFGQWSQFWKTTGGLKARGTWGGRWKMGWGGGRSRGR